MDYRSKIEALKLKLEKKQKRLELHEQKRLDKVKEKEIKWKKAEAVYNILDLQKRVSNNSMEIQLLQRQLEAQANIISDLRKRAYSMPESKKYIAPCNDCKHSTQHTGKTCPKLGCYESNGNKYFEPIETVKKQEEPKVEKRCKCGAELLTANSKKYGLCGMCLSCNDCKYHTDLTECELDGKCTGRDCKWEPRE